MKIYTTHLKPGAPPALVREGFSWAAAIFGGIWLLLHRAWIASALTFAIVILVWRLTRGVVPVWPGIGIFLLQGWLGRDLWRWSLARRGYAEGPVVVAAGEDAAFARLLGEVPELARA